jgi:FixJ family two-component response regulator
MSVNLLPVNTICVVDDISWVRQLLALEGFESETFNKPNAFLEHARNRAANLVVLNVWIPGKNGIELRDCCTSYRQGRESSW